MMDAFVAGSPGFFFSWSSVLLPIFPLPLVTPSPSHRPLYLVVSARLAYLTTPYLTLRTSQSFWCPVSPTTCPYDLNYLPYLTSPPLDVKSFHHLFSPSSSCITETQLHSSRADPAFFKGFSLFVPLLLRVGSAAPAGSCSLPRPSQGRQSCVQSYRLRSSLIPLSSPHHGSMGPIF
jgi:hypothetical protein